MDALNYEHIVRIFVAAFMGGIIGLEREYRSKVAGFRTHFLVSLGSAIFMIMSVHGYDIDQPILEKYQLDPSRIAANIVTGIGFIGAGAIIFQKHAVKGLTTAAGIWVTAAIGMECGAGYYSLSIATTILVLFCLEMFNFVLNRMGKKTVSLTITVRSKNEVNSIISKLRESGFEINSYNIEMKAKEIGVSYVISLDVKVNRKEYNTKVPELLSKFDEISINTL